MRNFVKGTVVGFVGAAVVFAVVLGLVVFHYRDREIVEYAERQIEIEVLREDYVNRDPVEFIEDIPDVRRAVDGAAAEFERKRDEAVQRFRSRLVD